MSTEEALQQSLIARFDFLNGHIRIQRPRRIWADVPAAAFEQVLPVLVKEFQFNILCTITGLDAGDNLELIYHLAQIGGVTLSLKTAVPKANPVWKTVLATFPGCTIYERELVDLLGLQVEGLPPGSRYPLTDDWPAGQFPLRKDWKPAAAAADKEAQP